ncbi:hypothetical protein UlMin_019768 [Ulmus minor]
MLNLRSSDLIHAIFKLLWSRRHEKLEGTNALAWAGISKKGRLMTATGNALKLSYAMQRAATIAEAEGVGKIEATHLERILLQLLLDF